MSAIASADNPTIGELLDLPAQVFRGDFVLNLSEGVTRPEETLRQYVVTPQLVECFDNALTFISSALQARGSKAAYLHGSFGSGKSHFMAVLHLLLEHHPSAREVPDLAGVMVKHDWTDGRKFLLVPYHLIGARNLESAILGGYVEHIRRHHPEAPLPGVFVADAIFKNAEELRGHLGDNKFFELLNQASGPSKWKGLARGWTLDSYRQALQAPPSDEARTRLVGALVQNLLTSYRGVADAKEEAYVDLDHGLSILCRHAQSLGYDAVILFLDELILWLASHAADIAFVQREGQKLAKLVEFKNARALPLISFVARQRDLRELVGDRFTGSEQLNFAAILGHWEGRFHTIRLEDRNLPAIAQKRVLRPKNPEARGRIDRAFDRSLQVKQDVLETLMTPEADRTMFRQTYPFSPAFVQTLVAVSSALQRERTALKIMLQLLVEKRDLLKLGDLVPVGDLWDAVAGGEEAFSDVLLVKVRYARKLYQQKLRPMLEEDPANFVANDRIVKTLLLADLCPEVPALKDLTPAKLAALNWGSIRSPLPGREGQEVLARLRNWAPRVGEIRMSDSGANPVITLQVSGVDTEGILQKAAMFDNPGNRCRKVRDMLLEGIRLSPDDLFVRHAFGWRGTERGCGLLLTTIRELNDDSLRCHDEEWKVVLDWPFDPDNHDRSEAVTRIDRFLANQKETRTVAWIPAYLSHKAQADLGKLVILDHLLRGENLDQYAQHLSAQDRITARSILDSQRNALTNSLRNTLESAYGFRDNPPPGMVETEGADQRLFSLWPNITFRTPVGATFKAALEHLVSQGLEQQFPAHPVFERDIKTNDLRKILDVLTRTVQSGEPRALVDRKEIPIMQKVAEPLELGRQGDTHFVPTDTWRHHFERQLASSGEANPTVRQLREWIDRPQARGLPEEVENLLILVYALQSNRAFFRHGTTPEPTLERIPGDLELRTLPLPSAEEWETAQQRVADFFDITSTGPLTATNVSGLARQIQNNVEKLQADGARLPQCISSAASRLGIATEQLQSSARYRTACTAAQLLQSLHRREPTPCIQQLALARVETSAPAMGKSLTSAGEVITALQDERWSVVESLATITDARQGQAQDLLQGLSQALLADEHVSGFALALRNTLDAAYRLLAQAPAPSRSTGTSTGPDGASAGVSPPPMTVTGETRVIDQGHQGSLDAKAFTELVENLTRQLQENPRRRLAVQWILREEEPRT